MDSTPALGVPVTAAGDAPKDPGASESHQSYTEKDFEGTCTSFFTSCIFATNKIFIWKNNSSRKSVVFRQIFIESSIIDIRR